MKRTGTRESIGVLIVGMVFALLMVMGGCELRFQDPFYHPAGNADTDIFDDDSDDGPPYGGVITFRTITVDGNRDDWDGVSSIIYDAEGDSTYAGAGGDIVRVLLAADDTFLYFSIELADETPSTTQKLQIERSMVLQKDDLLFSGVILRQNGENSFAAVDNTTSWVYTLP